MQDARLSLRGVALLPAYAARAAALLGLTALAAARPASAGTPVFDLPSSPSTTGGGYAGLFLGNLFQDSTTESVTALDSYDGGSLTNTADYDGLMGGRLDIFDQTTGAYVSTVVVNADTILTGTQSGQYYYPPATGTNVIGPGDVYVNSMQLAEANTKRLPNAPQLILDSTISYVHGSSGTPGVMGNSPSQSVTGPNPTYTAKDAYLSGQSFEMGAAPEPSEWAALGFTGPSLGGLPPREGPLWHGLCRRPIERLLTAEGGSQLPTQMTPL